MKKLSKLITFLMLMIVSIPAFSQTGDEVVGEWINPSGEGKIRIFKSGDHYYGTLFWLKNPNTEKGEPKLDDKNPDVSKRSRKVQGLMILKSFTFNTKDKHWENGEIYDPKSGKTYSCIMKLESADKLSIRGFVGISLIGRSEVWTRVK
jgi:uncharacterized protein (DUF2147 family)